MTFADSMPEDFEAVSRVGARLDDGEMSFGGGRDGRHRPQLVRRKQQRLQTGSAPFGVEAVDDVVQLIDDDDVVMRVLEEGGRLALFVAVVFLLLLFRDEADSADGQRQTRPWVVERHSSHEISVVVEDAEKVFGDVGDEELELLGDGGRGGDESRRAIATRRSVLAADFEPSKRLTEAVARKDFHGFDGRDGESDDVARDVHVHRNRLALLTEKNGAC